MNKGQTSIVAELTRAGADLNTKDELGHTALHLAVNKGQTSIVAELTRAGADVNIKDQLGRTALHLAERNGHKAIVDILVAAEEANLNNKDRIEMAPCSDEQ